MKHFLTAVFIFSFFISNAQDVIMLRDGSELKAIVQEVAQDQVKYKKFDNKTGPVYSLGKVKIFKIKYKNLTEEFFGDYREQSNTSNANSQEAISANPATVIQKSTSRKDADKQALTIIGKKIYNNGIKLSNDQVMGYLTNSPEAINTFKSGKSGYSSGLILSWTGLAMAVAGLVITLTPQKSYYSTDTNSGLPLSLGGLGVTLVGNLLASSGKNKMVEGVNIYNAEQRRVSINISPLINQNGIGVCMKF
jgi:hypothetical protein